MPGVYISWPFCAQKCTYCNFASGVFPPELERAYGGALIGEIARFSWSEPADTVYLGGGTPSGMDVEILADVLRNIPGRPWSESTMEAAPGSLTESKIAAWCEAGINRVSLGVQSFVKRELAQTGRKHDAAIVAKDVSMLRAGGIENISIDLIAGLPGQTPESWRESLDALIALAVPHASVYMLEVDEDSRLGAEILSLGARYGAAAVPNEDRIVEFYESSAERLEGAGLPRYEISNFARPGFESLHNLKYWRRESYAGFGADAHSCDGIRRWQNVESAKEYVDRWQRGESVREEETNANEAEEKFFVGLRLSEGVEPDERDWERHGQAFERFLAGGVMEREGSRLRLTARGILISNEIFEEFIAA